MTPKRFVFVLNKPNRETAVMNSIAREIRKEVPDATIRLIRFDPDFVPAVMAVRPEVIFTYPMTSVGLSLPYYLFKHHFRSKVVCFRAEGIIDPASPQSVANHVGYDAYGSTLVDYELFWGPGPAKLIGDELLKRGKVSSPGRIRAFGYPRLERYFGIAPAEGYAALPEAVLQKLSRYGRARTLLFATGFHFANYNRETIYAAKDLNAEEKEHELLGIIEEVKRFRASWIDSIRRAAVAHPELLFVLKKHPIERRPDYETLEDVPNVLYVADDIDIADLMERSGLFFHYGSTSLVDAYLAGVPGIYVHSTEERCHNWFPDLGWPSARSVTPDEFASVVEDFRAGRIRQDRADPAIQAVLDWNFNIRDGEPYRPAAALAEFLLSPEPAQKVSFYDPYLWRALWWYYYPAARRRFGPPVKKALRSVRELLQPSRR